MMTTPKCINLEECFGHRFRIRWEADGATKGQWPREEWPWLMEIHGRRGMISPWGGELLQAMSSSRRIGRMLRALPFVLHTKGDVEAVIHFRVDHVEEVFALIQPYRRRQVSEAERKRLAELSARHGFKRAVLPISESEFPAPETTNGAQDEPEPVVAE